MVMPLSSVMEGSGVDSESRKGLDGEGTRVTLAGEGNSGSGALGASAASPRLWVQWDVAHPG